MLNSLAYYVLYLIFPFETQTDEEDRAMAMDNVTDTEGQVSKNDVTIDSSSDEKLAAVGRSKED